MLGWSRVSREAKVGTHWKSRRLMERFDFFSASRRGAVGGFEQRNGIMYIS
jgi:hypothetical protein